MSTVIRNCTGVILAGGENTRMPVLKAFIEVDGQTIIEKNLAAMKTLFQEFCIVTNQPESYVYLGAPLLGDVYDIRGPMTGILTALLNSSAQWVFISACDMPFMNVTLIKYMASNRDNYDAVIPKYSPPLNSPFSQGGHSAVEPLFGFYARQLLAPMEKAVLTGSKSLRDFLRNKRVKYITIEEIREIDTRVSSFVNLNSPDDIERYLQKKDIIRFRRKVKGR